MFLLNKIFVNEPMPMEPFFTFARTHFRFGDFYILKNYQVIVIIRFNNSVTINHRTKS